MPRHFIPRNSSVHRIACIALYRALLEQCARFPIPAELERGPVNPLKHLIRKQFRRNIYDTSPRLVVAALKNGYTTEKLFRSAGNGNEAAKSQIVSILTILRAQSDASASISQPPRPPLRRYPEPWPGAPKLLETRPLPSEKLAGRRRIPSLASVSGSHSTFLRLGKPHNPYLSRVLRDIQEQQQNRFNASDSILLDAELARDEEKWEYITSRELSYEGKSLKEWRAKQPGLDWGENNWTSDLLDVDSKIMDRVFDQQKKQKERTIQMIDIVQKEKELLLEERANRKHEKILVKKLRKLDESHQTN